MTKILYLGNDIYQRSFIEASRVETVTSHSTDSMLDPRNIVSNCSNVSYIKRTLKRVMQLSKLLCKTKQLKSIKSMLPSDVLFILKLFGILIELVT